MNRQLLQWMAPREQILPYGGPQGLVFSYLFDLSNKFNCMII